MMGKAKSEYAVEMTGIDKSFALVKALSQVNLKVKRGTIHALLGENGAGKSTLMNILYGFYGKDAGEIKVNGEGVNIKNPKAAIALGIGMVHQHFMLVNNFTIAENIVLGSEITRTLGRLDRTKMNAEIRDLGKKYGLEVDPEARISDVSVATQQRVEILKMLYRGMDILILDEPTAVLTPQEIQSLITTMQRLVADGKTIIIITHKLKEIKQSAEFCTIIRRGVLIDTVKVAEVTQEQLANMMVGREISLVTEKGEKTPGPLIFEIKDLHVRDGRGTPRVRGLCLNIRSGEILGIAGIDGNGQSELIDAITGLRLAESGSIIMGGQEILNQNPAGVHAAGIRTIHEDRQRRGLVLDFSVAENFILETYDAKAYCRGGRLRWPAIFEHARGLIKRFDLRPSGCENAAARGLSGGNQQKLIIAREIEQEPKLLIAVQPTRGLDVGSIEFVRKSLVEQRDSGKAVLLISLEIDEILDISDRIGVLYAGEIVAELDPKETDEKEIGLLMAGGQK